MKTVAITGASKGIGKALVDRFAKGGYSVAFCSRSEEDLSKFAGELRSAYPEQSFIYTACDVSKPKDLEAFGQLVYDEFGKLDVLINNAGFFVPGTVLEEEAGSLEKMIETNLYSAYHLSRSLVPIMRKQGHGDIFNICSVASLFAYPNGGSYSISKFAMLGLSKALREELKEDGIRVCSVLPGATLTASWEGVDLPEDRFISVEDLANSIWEISQLSKRTVVEEILIRPQLGDI